MDKLRLASQFSLVRSTWAAWHTQIIASLPVPAALRISSLVPDWLHSLFVINLFPNYFWITHTKVQIFTNLSPSDYLKTSVWNYRFLWEGNLSVSAIWLCMQALERDSECLSPGTEFSAKICWILLSKDSVTISDTW